MDVVLACVTLLHSLSYLSLGPHMLPTYYFCYIDKN